MFSTDTYHVVKEVGVFEEVHTNWSVVNTEHGTIETRCDCLPAAIMAARQLTEVLEKATRGDVETEYNEVH